MKLKLLLPLFFVTASFACAPEGVGEGGASDDASTPPQDGGEDGGEDGGLDSGTPDAGDSGTPDGGGAAHCTNYRPVLKNLLWGDIHVHTSFSHDAFDFGTPSGPAAAYAFARGATIPWRRSTVSPGRRRSPARSTSRR